MKSVEELGGDLGLDDVGVRWLEKRVQQERADERARVLSQVADRLSGNQIVGWVSIEAIDQVIASLRRAP